MGIELPAEVLKLMAQGYSLHKALAIAGGSKKTEKPAPKTPPKK